MRRFLDNSYGDKVFVYPNIPTEKFNNAKKKYGNRANINIDDVVLLIDDTVFGSAECGVIITNDSIYIGEDFESPLYFSFDRIFNIYTKKSMLSNSLFINDKKVKGFTQPSYKTIQKVFDDINRYINYYHSDENNKENEDNHEYINEEDNDESIFDFIEDDSIYNTIQKLEAVNKIDSVTSFFLGSEDNINSSEKIRKVLRKYYLKNIIYIRNKGFEAKGYQYFSNDFATIESIIFLSTLLINELDRRDVPNNKIATTIDLGLREIFPDTSSIIRYVLECSLLSMNLKIAIKRFYIRLTLTNIYKTEAYSNFDEFNSELNDMLSSNEDSIACIEAVSNYTEIVDFDHIFMTTRETADDILDLIRFRY